MKKHLFSELHLIHLQCDFFRVLDLRLTKIGSQAWLPFFISINHLDNLYFIYIIFWKIKNNSSIIKQTYKIVIQYHKQFETTKLILKKNIKIIIFNIFNIFFSWKFGIMKKYPLYLQSDFFIVLDLRLTKIGSRARLPFFVFYQIYFLFY